MQAVEKHCFLHNREGFGEEGSPNVIGRLNRILASESADFRGRPINYHLPLGTVPLGVVGRRQAKEDLRAFFRDSPLRSIPCTRNRHFVPRKKQTSKALHVQRLFLCYSIQYTLLSFLGCASFNAPSGKPNTQLPIPSHSPSKPTASRIALPSSVSITSFALCIQQLPMPME